MDKKVITLKIESGRDDKGQTENYRIYAGGGVVQVKNRRGETVSKNAILGGNGTIYIANEIAAKEDAFVLIPKSLYDRLLPNEKAPVTKKGKGK